MVLLIDLPDEMLENIFSYLSYEEIAKNRIVCKRFDRACQKLLNHGFIFAGKYQAQCLRWVKSQLPRRESERLNHPLARHCFMLMYVESRIAYLEISIFNYVDMYQCCFIPGKVIDEILRILRYVKNYKDLPSTVELFKELDDISSMAIEYFKENILPTLKYREYTLSENNFEPYNLPTEKNLVTYESGPTTTTFDSNQNTQKLKEVLKKIRNQTRRYNSSFSSVNSRINKLGLRMRRQNYKMRLQSHKLQQQSKKIHDQNLQLAKVNNHLEEWNQKMGELTAELSRTREDLQKFKTIVDNNCNKHSDITSP